MVTLIPNLWVHLYLNFHVYPFGVAELGIERINIEHMKDLLDADMEIHAYINQQKWRVQGITLFDEALRDIKVQLEENQK